jgi:hypothetical protein
MPTLHSCKGRNATPIKKRLGSNTNVPSKMNKSPSHKNKNTAGSSSSPPEILAFGAVLDHLARGGGLKEAGNVYTKEIKDKHDPFLKQSYGTMEKKRAGQHHSHHHRPHPPTVTSTVMNVATAVLTGTANNGVINRRRKGGKKGGNHLPFVKKRQVTQAQPKDRRDDVDDDGSESSDDDDDDDDDDEDIDENESGWDDEDDDDDDEDDDDEEDDDTDIREDASDYSFTTRENDSVGQSTFVGRTKDDDDDDDDEDESTVFFEDGDEEDDSTIVSETTKSIPTMQTNQTDLRSEYTTDEYNDDYDNGSVVEPGRDETKRSIIAKEGNIVVRKTDVKDDPKRLFKVRKNRARRYALEKLDKLKIKQPLMAGASSSIPRTRSHPASIVTRSPGGAPAADINRTTRTASRSLDKRTRSANYNDETIKTISQLKQTVANGQEINIEIVQASTVVYNTVDDSASIVLPPVANDVDDWTDFDGSIILRDHHQLLPGANSFLCNCMELPNVKSLECSPEDMLLTDEYTSFVKDQDGVLLASDFLNMVTAECQPLGASEWHAIVMDSPDSASTSERAYSFNVPKVIVGPTTTTTPPKTIIQPLKDISGMVVPQHAMADDMNTIFTSASVIDRSGVCAFIAAIEGMRAIEAAKSEEQSTVIDNDDDDKNKEKVILFSESAESKLTPPRPPPPPSSKNDSKKEKYGTELFVASSSDLDKSEQSMDVRRGIVLSVAASSVYDKSEQTLLVRNTGMKPSERSTGLQSKVYDDGDDGLTVFGQETDLNVNEPPKDDTAELNGNKRSNKKPISLKKAVRFLFRNKKKNSSRRTMSDLSDSNTGSIQAVESASNEPAMSSATTTIEKKLSTTSTTTKDDPLVAIASSVSTHEQQQVLDADVFDGKEKLMQSRTEDTTHEASSDNGVNNNNKERVVTDLTIRPSLSSVAKDETSGECCSENNTTNNNDTEVTEHLELTDQKVSPWSNFFGLVSPTTAGRSIEPSKSHTSSVHHKDADHTNWKDGGVDDNVENDDDDVVEDKIVAMATHCNVADPLGWGVSFFGHEEAKEDYEDNETVVEVPPDHDGIGVELVISDTMDQNDECKKEPSSAEEIPTTPCNAAAADYDDTNLPRSTTTASTPSNQQNTNHTEWGSFFDRAFQTMKEFDFGSHHKDEQPPTPQAASVSTLLPFASVSALKDVNDCDTTAAAEVVEAVDNHDVVAPRDSITPVLNAVTSAKSDDNPSNNVVPSTDDHVVLKSDDGTVVVDTDTTTRLAPFLPMQEKGDSIIQKGDDNRPPFVVSELLIEEGIEWTASQAGLQIIGDINNDNSVNMSKTSSNDVADTDTTDATRSMLSESMIEGISDYGSGGDVVLAKGSNNNNSIATSSSTMSNDNNNTVIGMKKSNKKLLFRSSLVRNNMSLPKSKSIPKTTTTTTPRNNPFWGIGRKSKRGGGGDHHLLPTNQQQQGQREQNGSSSLLHNLNYVVEVGKDRVRQSE